MHKLGKQWVEDWLQGLGRLAILCREIFRSLVLHRPSWPDLMQQLHFIGVKSQSVVLITGAFTGMVMCAQTYFQFHKVKM
ncbi:MAG TPA: ABC transporter permease, partial [Roseimicrobium sp.]|nr:ABC transporter permease [Roseimicrobium sp.]